MKKVIITMGILYSTAGLGYQVNQKNDKAFITPNKLNSVKSLVSPDAVEFCDNAKRYLELFKTSMDNNNCAQTQEEEDNSPQCSAVKRAFKRVATAHGVLGTDYPIKTHFKLEGGESIPMEDSDKDEIAYSLGLLKEQIVYPSKVERTSISNISLSLKQESSIFSAFPLKGAVSPYVKNDRLHFEDRLSVCAYLEGDYFASAKVKNRFTSIDKAPQSFIRFVDTLKKRLERSYVSYANAEKEAISKHEKSHALLYLALDFAKLEKKVESEKVLKTYSKVEAFGKMDLWWNFFFKTDDVRGSLSMKQIGLQNIKDFYREEKIIQTQERWVDVKSEVSNEI